MGLDKSSKITFCVFLEDADKFYIDVLYTSIIVNTVPFIDFDFVLSSLFCRKFALLRLDFMFECVVHVITRVLAQAGRVLLKLDSLGSPQ